MLEKVSERMATSEDTILVIKRESEGKMLVTSRHWDAKALLRNEVLEVRNVDGRLHVARKVHKPDEWDPPVAVYDPYGPGKPVARDADHTKKRQHRHR